MARSFVWTPQKERACELLDAGTFHSQAALAVELGVTRRTVEGWCRRPAFRARLAALATARNARWEREWQAKLAAIRAQRQAELDALAPFDAEAYVAGRLAYYKAVAGHRKRPGR